MHNILKNKIIFFLIFLPFLLFHPVLFLLIRLFPFIDIPFHLAVATINKHYENADYFFNFVYHIPTFLKSNIFHLIFINIPVFENIETGNRIFYAIYSLLLPLSVFFLIKLLKGNVYFSLLSFFYIVNLVCAWGFAGNTISIPFFIINVVFFYKYFIENKYYYLILILFDFFLIFFCHFQTAIFSVVIFTLYSLLYFGKYLKKMILSFLFIVPVILLMTYVYLLDTIGDFENMVEFFLRYYSDEFIKSIQNRIQVLFVNEHYHWSEEPLGGIIGIFISFLVVLPIIYFILFKMKKGKMKKDIRNGFIFVLLLSSLFFYLFLPEDIPGQNIVSMRFSIYFFISLVVLASFQNIDNKFRNIYFPFVFISVFIFFVLSAQYFIYFQKENKNFNSSLFSDLKNSDRLGGLIFDSKFRGRPVYIHFNNYYTVWNKGISTGYVDYRFAFLKRKVSKDILPTPYEWASIFNNYDNGFSGIEYILVRDSIERKIDSFYVYNKTDKWMLYKNKNITKWK